MSYLRERCTHCKATPGNPCVIPGTQQRLTLTPAHPCRMEAAGFPDPGPAAVAEYRKAQTDTPPVDPPTIDPTAAEAAAEYIDATLQRQPR